MRRTRLERVEDPSVPGWTKIRLGLSRFRRDVSRLWVGTLSMRVGSAVVKTGGIAGVSTDKRHRRRGYSRLVMEEAHRFLDESGHQLSLLFGLPGLYERFGYAPVLAETTMTVRSSDARAVLADLKPGGVNARPLVATDWPAVLEVYHAGNLGRTGSIVRPAETWDGYRYGSEWGCGTETVVLEAGREVVAFATFDAAPDRCRIVDLGCAAPAALSALLETVTGRAEELGIADFELKLPPDHPFVLFCRRCGGTVRTAYERNAGGMARILAPRLLLEGLTGLLGARLRASSQAGWEGVLELKTDSESIALELGGGRVRLAGSAAESAVPTHRVCLPQTRLMQLIMGYRDIAAMAFDKDVEVDGEVLPLVAALFPVGHPWIAMPDRF